MEPETPDQRLARWKAHTESPDVKPFFDAIFAASDLKELGKAKRAALKAYDAGTIKLNAGAFEHFLAKKKSELAALDGPQQGSASDARVDQILRTRDSTGRATARRRY